MSNKTIELTERKCQACHGDIPPLTEHEAQDYLTQVSGWILSPDGKEITKELKLKNFLEVLAVVNKIGTIAEAEDHHPNLYIHSYKKLRIELSTHAIHGLSENDFILAAKIDHAIS